MPNLPYAQQAGTLEKMLEKIKEASVPDNFSQDFVAKKLQMKGGTSRSIIPFIKKMGFVSIDGTPTQRYKEFRNPAKSGLAVAEAVREVFSELFEINENVHTLDNGKLKELIIEYTGAEANSNPVQKTFATFKTLRDIADFKSLTSKKDNPKEKEDDNPNLKGKEDDSPTSFNLNNIGNNGSASSGLNLSYTINLNLPVTTDIEVYNSIFKSLKEHILQE